MLQMMSHHFHSLDFIKVILILNLSRDETRRELIVFKILDYNLLKWLSFLPLAVDMSTDPFPYILYLRSIFTPLQTI